MNINAVLQSINIQQLIISALALSAGGIVGFWFKDVPKRIWQWIVQECTCTLTITAQHFCYFGCMTFLANKLKDKKLKSYKAIGVHQSENSELSRLGIGYGTHLIWLNKTPLLITLEKDTNNHQVADKDIITIRKWGRSKKVFDNLLNKINDVALINKNEIETYQYTTYWSQCLGVYKRKLDTIFIPQNQKNMIINAIKHFNENEQWYTDNGIPYHLGILLYGPPGTGKTSIIKAIATHFNMKINYLPTSKLHNINQATTEMRKNSLLVIEDIDCQSAVVTRDSVPILCEENENYQSYVIQDTTIKTNFSDILNSLDGLLSAHGYIFIATTNHIEQLDKALLRPGRIDLTMEIGYVNLETFNEFLQHYYNITTIENINIRNNITVAQLQQKLLEQKTVEEIIEWAKE